MPSLASVAFLLRAPLSQHCHFSPFVQLFLFPPGRRSSLLLVTVLHLSALSHPPLLGPPHLCHPSISLYWIWSCVIVSASLLGWRLSKGPQDPSHTEGLQPCQRCPLSSPPCVFSPHLLSLLSAHRVPLHLSGTEEKVKSFFF